MKEKEYDWMVKYTPQREWIEGKGILLWLAFFFIEVGASLYLVALFFDSPWGLFLGWLITAILGGGCHFFYLGNPLRFWRAVLRPKTSWISRGMIFVLSFLLLGILPFIPGLQDNQAIGIMSGILAFLVVIYGGFVMNFVNALALWNTALIPVLYLIGSLWGGSEIMMVIVINSGNLALAERAEQWVRILLLGYALLIVIYLWAVTYTTNAGRQSVSDILKGKLSAPFYLTVVLLGILVPVFVVFLSFLSGVGVIPHSLILLGVVCGLLGDLGMRYCILKGALYSPLIPQSAY